MPLVSVTENQVPLWQKRRFHQESFEQISSPLEDGCSGVVGLNGLVQGGVDVLGAPPGPLAHEVGGDGDVGAEPAVELELVAAAVSLTGSSVR